MDQTPKATQRKRLGMRRVIPQSAPPKLLVQSATTPTSNQSALRENMARLGNYTVPSKRLPENANAIAIGSGQPSTPLARKRCRVIVKRLHMTDSSSVQNSETVTNATDPPTQFAATKSIDEQICQLEKENENLNADIEAARKHENRIIELESLIAKWKAGAVEAIKRLKLKIQPPQNTTSILNHFNIPIEMFADSLSFDDEEEEENDA